MTIHLGEGVELTHGGTDFAACNLDPMDPEVPVPISPVAWDASSGCCKALSLLSALSNKRFARAGIVPCNKRGCRRRAPALGCF